MTWRNAHCRKPEQNATTRKNQGFTTAVSGCIEIGLKYYDDEEERVRWRESFPDDPIPEHEDPPYDRDRHLPKRDYS